MIEEIRAYFEEKKYPKFRFKQFEEALYKQQLTSFDEITVFPKHLRQELKEKFSLTSMFLVESHESEDTVKFVLKTKDGQFVESVLMLHRDGRRTVSKLSSTPFLFSLSLLILNP
jgi:23S rRNA (adenine2503-C2)-methyltransferase